MWKNISQWTALPLGVKEHSCWDWKWKWTESCSSVNSAPTERHANLPFTPVECKEQGSETLGAAAASQAAAPSELAQGGPCVLQGLKCEHLPSAKGSEKQLLLASPSLGSISV